MKEYLKIFTIFFRIGAFTFGGGYAMIPLIEGEIVGKNEWISSDEFLDALAVSQSLPGAVAINMSTFVGYKIRGIRGAIMACLGIILPSFFIILFLSGFLIKYKDNLYLKNAFKGVRPAVVALILVSVYKLQKSVEKSRFTYILFTVGIVMLIIFKMHPISVIIVSALAGYVHYGGK
ncbi:MAG: chromate transporter [Acidaminobacteraceae bacterium]